MYLNKSTVGLHGSSGRREGRWASKHASVVCGTSAVPLLPTLPRTSPPESSSVVHHPTDCNNSMRKSTTKKEMPIYSLAETAG